MVVGATGAGKSTLIDGLINFYLDVAWEEEARFKLIDLTPEEQKKTDEVLCQLFYIRFFILNLIRWSLQFLSLASIRVTDKH